MKSKAPPNLTSRVRRTSAYRSRCPRGRTERAAPTGPTQRPGRGAEVCLMAKGGMEEQGGHCGAG